MALVAACSALSGPGCSAGRSCAEDEHGLGACCRADQDCSSGLSCFSQVPRGLCSQACQSASDCPSGAFCIRIVSRSAGDLGLICLAGCSGPQDCPEGLFCLTANEEKNIRVCFPET
jgi:hypothetical protein